MSRKTLKQRIALGFGCLIGFHLAGCATVDQIHSDGTETRTVVFGAPIIQVQMPAGDAEIVKSTGLGLEVMNGDATLGVYDTTYAAFDKSCHVILIGNSEAQLRNFVELTGKSRTVCSDQPRK